MPLSRNPSGLFGSPLSPAFSQPGLEPVGGSRAAADLEPAPKFQGGGAHGALFHGGEAQQVPLAARGAPYDLGNLPKFRTETKDLEVILGRFTQNRPSTTGCQA
jgi:hypothetical protein